MNPIGISYPIKKGDNGYFEYLYDSTASTRQSIRHLLLTKPGTISGRPEYGSMFWSFLFENKTSIIKTEIEDTIKTEIKRWVLGVEVKSVTISFDESYNTEHNVSINVEYMITSSHTLDSVLISL